MQHSSIDYTVKQISKLRQQYITQFTKSYGGKSVLKYVGQMDPDDIPKGGKELLNAKSKGAEIMIEYHMFEMNDKTPVIGQWRLV